MVFRKWGDRPHWEFDARRLGSDAYGHWVGAPAGTHLARPGAEFVADSAFVTLVPRDEPFVATFYDRHHEGPADPVELYVDITTVPAWADGRVTTVDLDLDVVRGRSGRVWVDDEDEFAEHRVRFGYPADVVELALTSCEAVRRAVELSHAPFDTETPKRWFAALEGAMMAP